jgi:coproporphyrinogen III oxidase-like Fe-S oxidoreductase
MQNLVANIAGIITKYEGKKFLQLPDTIDETLINWSHLDKGGDISLYIHIPFCHTLCPFCCFNRYLFNEDKARAYFDQLKKELDLYIQRGFRFTHFYFGGGTPTLLMDELLQFIAYLRQKFDVREISVETTPGEITKENIRALKSAGIHRLSIGIQSFDDEIAKAMGRVLCSGEEVKQKLLMVKDEFNTINIDLIFNFPLQTVESFRDDIEVYKSLGNNQITFYPLMPSPHKKTAMERKFSHVSNVMEMKYYDIILEEMLGKGYKPSTVWCFSHGERMIDEYIVDYADYIGIGSGAVSLVRGNFYINAFSLERYGKMIEDGKFPIVRWRKLSQREYLRYFLLTKLFGTKVDLQKMGQALGVNVRGKLWFELMLLKISGVTQGQDQIKVTRRGMYVVSVMMREFFTALNSLREYCIEHQI